MDSAYLGRRIKALRETACEKQADLAAILNLKDRQSVAAIEAGSRKITGEELIKLVNHFRVSLEDIANPFLLFNREGFSWRQTGVRPDDLKAFEKTASEWIGAYRTLKACRSRSSRQLLPSLRLTYNSSFEDAVAAGESVAQLLNLGEAPAFKLAEAIEERFDILVLMVDAIPGVSGAACHLPELDTILINRAESPGRRRADLAHELFHILTWDMMKPEWSESAEPLWETVPSRKMRRNERIEQLADNFNFGILMPGWALDTLPEPREDAEWINAAANKLGVTGPNLKWRLVNSGRARGMARVENDDLKRLARLNTEPTTVPLFSCRFISVIGKAIENGDISARRAASLLQTSLDDLGELFDEYNINRPEELCL